MLLDASILTLRRPDTYNYKTVRDVFMNKDWDGTQWPSLGGSSATLYDNRDDLSGLTQPYQDDQLTTFLKTYCGVFFLERIPEAGDKVMHYSSSRIKTFVGLVNVLLASGFLFGAIYNLYFVEQEQVKLGLIAGYTTAFALTISVISTAKRSEISDLRCVCRLRCRPRCLYQRRSGRWC